MVVKITSNALYGMRAHPSSRTSKMEWPVHLKIMQTGSLARRCCVTMLLFYATSEIQAVPAVPDAR